LCLGRIVERQIQVAEMGSRTTMARIEHQPLTPSRDVAAILFGGERLFLKLMPASCTTRQTEP
jgi:hypothetical protein